jgi:predicted component of type VI protein secretion system
MALRLRYNGRSIVLTTGQLFIGRSSDCHVVVDDVQASRRHAVITMGKSGAFVTDLASKSGVRVNGETINGSRRLARGDAVLIASLRIAIEDVAIDADDEPTDPRLRSTIAPPAPNVAQADFQRHLTPPLGITAVRRAEPAPVPETLDDHDDQRPEFMTRTQEAPRVALPPDSAPRGPESSQRTPEPSQRSTSPGPAPQGESVDPTRIGKLPPLPSFPRGETLRALASMGEKALALGRAEEAERILQRALLDTLDGVRRGEGDAAIAELAASLAAKLASATGAGRWFDYAIAVYAARGDIAPAAVVDLLHAAVRKVKTIDKAAFRDWFASVQSAAGDSPARRFLVQRLDGLRGLVDLK